MKKLIVKSNEWYDNLKEPKRTLFFLIVVMGTLIFVQYLTYGTDGKWSKLAFPIWAGIISIYRCSYIFIKAWEDYCSKN